MFQSIIFGVIQGLTEFLPVSSTAHLILVPWFFGWQDPGLAFDVILHWGTLLGVLVYFWRDWIKLLRGAWRWASGVTPWKNNLETKLLSFIIVASIPGAIFGYFLSEKAKGIFRNPLLIAATLLIFGFVILIADKLSRQRKLENISFIDSILIGISQAIAIIPGVSRSGATISAGLILGLDRVAAARFSFLLSVPIIFGAGLAESFHLLKTDLNTNLIVGLVASAISGFFAIWFLIKYVERKNYKFFVWYRIILAFVILIAILIK